MLSVNRLALLGALALGAAACATTNFTSTWTEPTAQPLDRGKKVATVMMSTRDALRRSAEVAMATEIRRRGAEAVESYTLLPGESARDTARARQVLGEQGVDAVLIMRVVGKDQQVTSSPGTYWGGPAYMTFWGAGYYGYGWGAVYDPGYVRTDTIVLVETLIYSLEQDKLVWAAQSETTNPEKVGPFIKELTAKTAAELRKQGLIQ